MVRLSQDRLLAAAKRVNPKVRLIIKYPQWYDEFHERGYEVVRETADFDRIWVGTETRDYRDRHWGGTPQYEAYFIMRWLGGIGGAEVRRRLVRSLRHHRADLHRAGPADRPGRGRRVDAVLLRLACSGAPGRKTSRPCGGTSPSCWRSPKRSAAGRSSASPPTSPPTATRRTSRGYSISWACWACRWSLATSFPNRRQGRVLLAARAEGPGAGAPSWRPSSRPASRCC